MTTDNQQPPTTEDKIIKTREYFKPGFYPTIFDVFEQLHDGNWNVEQTKVLQYYEFKEYFHYLTSEDHDIYLKRLFKLYIGHVFEKLINK